MPFTIGGEWVPEKQTPQAKKPISVCKEKRKNSWVTIVKHLNLNEDQLKDLAKKLKQCCACGGTVKNGVIELQGDKVDSVNKQLQLVGLVKIKQ